MLAKWIRNRPSLIGLSYLFLTSCFGSSPESVADEISEKTGLELNPDFTILEETSVSTDGAFDSDYTYRVWLEYKAEEEPMITDQIRQSYQFNCSEDSINMKGGKGIWNTAERGFKFIHSNIEENRNEPFTLFIDTIENRLDYEVVHL